jgi:hypothetical protein
MKANALFGHAGESKSPMKKFSLSVLFIFASLLFANSSSAQNPNKITLEFSKGPFIKGGKFCDVIARVAYVSGGQSQPKPGWTVVFVVMSGPGPVPASGASDANGLVKRRITHNTEILAKVTYSQNNVNIVSNSLKCNSPGLNTK